MLCRGVTAFNLRYFDGSQWQQGWDSTAQNNELPAAVEVTLTLVRPIAAGQNQELRYVRVFPLSCSALVTDQIIQNNSTNTTGSTGTTTGTTTGGKTP